MLPLDKEYIEIMYKIIDEKLGLASCSLSDLTMQQVTCILNQFEDGAPISTLTLFYDKKADIVVLNEDNEDFDIYLGLAEVFLKSDREKAKDLVDKISSGCCETLKVLRDVRRARKIKEELRINGHQMVVGVKGTYLHDVFNGIIKKYDRFKSPMFLMSQAYTYGVIQGKREERARRKGGVVA